MDKQNGADPKKFDILNLRTLHFEKLVPLHNTSKQNTRIQIKSSKTKKETESKDRIYKKFCSLGYYDQMSYVRSNSEDSILDYKHCFLIKYPYQKGEQRIMTDQRKKHLGFLHLCARAHRGRHGGMCAELHTGEEHTVRRGGAGIRRAEYNDCGEHGALLVRGDLSELDRLWLRPSGLLPVHAGMDRAQPQ